MRIALALVVLATVADATAHADCTAQHKQARALRDTLASVGETTPEYRAMMVKKIQDADTAATSCERAAADAKRADEARVAARKREMEADAKKQAAERFAIDELRSRPDFLRIAWSAFECSYEKERDAVLSNPFASPDQREGLKQTEHMLLRIRATMKYGKIVPLSCRSEEVAKLAFCIGDGGANAACSESDMARKARAEKEIIAAVQLVANPALTPEERQAKSEDDGMQILQPKF